MRAPSELKLQHAALLFIGLLAAVFLTPSGWAQDRIETLVPAADRLNFFDLLLLGGYWMIPILLMSLLVVTCTIERLIGLRRARVIPRHLVVAFRQLCGPPSQFDPQRALQICQKYPSAAATVVRVLLLKIGRPSSELEHTLAEASQREAERLHKNVRWLNLAAAVTPLMGLLGTVWGMIRAFHDTTQLAPGQNKADHLAEGIYIALVTTLGGLLVAIPAAIFAHYFEGRIQNAFLQIDELLFNLIPHVEKCQESPPAAERTSQPDRVSVES